MDITAGSTVMTAQLWVFLLSLIGFSCLMLAMPQHFSFLTRMTLGTMTSRLLRSIGWLTLLGAVFMAMQAWQGDIGFINWLGWLTIAGLLLAFYLPYWPWQAKKGGKSRSSKTAQMHLSDVKTTRISISLMAVLMLSIAVTVGWNFYTTPVKPLLRDDVFQGEIGTWTFSFAERNTQAPEVAALGLGVKDFVLRFCESCNAEIRTAYLKIRKPRTLRTAGVSFFGSRERFVEMAIPPAATLEDGLWLTVVSKKGEIFETRMEIERISPAMAEFIRNQL